MKKILSLAVASALAAPAMALPPIQDPGFNGSVNLGIGGGELESNFLAKIDGIDLDLGEDTINDFDSPEAESLTMAVANLDVGYTLSGGNTRFSLGTDIGSDLIEFDRAIRLSARHDFDSLGQMRADYLASPGAAPTQTWEDPYLLNESRKETDREMTGVRFIWHEIMGTGLEFKATVRNIDIDDERSGVSTNLTAAERRLLDREGDVYRYELGYKFQLNEQHMLRPSVMYVDKDLDGDAMAQDGVNVQLQHAYVSQGIQWTSQISYTDLEGDSENPLFNEVNDAENYSFASRIAFPGSIDFLGKWVPNVAVTWADSDSDIDFNDSNVWMIQAALLRRF